MKIRIQDTGPMANYDQGQWRSNLKEEEGQFCIKIQQQHQR